MRTFHAAQQRIDLPLDACATGTAAAIAGGRTAREDDAVERVDWPCRRSRRRRTRHCAQACSVRLEVVVVEAADDAGTGTSARNSEVIHAGSTTPPGAKVLRHGRELLCWQLRRPGCALSAGRQAIVAATPTRPG